ncbi:hypothetical protein BH09CHL1_BH09CHL1_10260 [soil metagenome]
MSVKFPKDLEERVLHLVEMGRFSDSGEAMRVAVDLLEERDRRLTWLQGAIAVADAEIARGEGIPFTADLLDEIEAESEQRFLRGEEPGPDVLP